MAHSDRYSSFKYFTNTGASSASPQFLNNVNKKALLGLSVHASNACFKPWRTTAFSASFPGVVAYATTPFKAYSTMAFLPSPAGTNIPAICAIPSAPVDTNSPITVSNVFFSEAGSWFNPSAMIVSDVRIRASCAATLHGNSAARANMINNFFIRLSFLQITTSRYPSSAGQSSGWQPHHR